MKSLRIITAITFLGMCLMLFHLTSCNKSITELYWHENPNGQVNVSPNGQTNNTTIETNDLGRLQKEVPFTILLPKYLPDGQNSYRFQMIFYHIDEEPMIRIEYYNLSNNKYVNIDEMQLSDYDLALISYPGHLETNAKLNGGSVITIEGIQMWEREEKNYIMPRFNYSWHQNNIGFSGLVYGYSQTTARKVVESVIK